MRYPIAIRKDRTSGCGSWACVRGLGAPVLALALGACGDGSVGPDDGPVVRDSAGVRIVEYAGTPADESPFAFSPEPVYRHGGGTGDYLFQSIWAGRLLPDGSAAISDDGNAEVVLLGPDGVSSTVLARSGEGPGEVRFVISLFAFGQDSLLLEDDGNARFTLFANGALARTVDLRDRTLNRGLMAHGVDPAGLLLMATASYRPGFEDAWLPGYMVRFDLDTGVPDTVASYDFVPYSPRDGPRNPFVGFGRVTAAGGQFVYTRSDKPEVTWRLPDGTVRQIVRWQAERIYPAAEHLDRYAATLRPVLAVANAPISDNRLDDLVARIMSEYEIDPDEPLPLFNEPFGDREGRVWLPAYEVDGPRRGPPYTVFSPDGEWLGKVDAPAGLRILDVAGGRVLGVRDASPLECSGDFCHGLLGVTRDEMEVESIVVYELVRLQLGLPSAF